MFTPGFNPDHKPNPIQCRNFNWYQLHIYKGLVDTKNKLQYHNTLWKLLFNREHPNLNVHSPYLDCMGMVRWGFPSYCYERIFMVLDGHVFKSVPRILKGQFSKIYSSESPNENIKIWVVFMYECVVKLTNWKNNGIEIVRLWRFSMDPRLFSRWYSLFCKGQYVITH